MRVTRRFVAFTATLALAAPSLLQASRLSAQSNEEAAVLQAVEALTKAMLDADRARLEELVADQLSYGHSSGVIQTKAQFVDVIINKQTVYESIVLSEPSTVIAGNNAIVRHMAAVDYEDGGKAGSAKIGVLEAPGAAGLQELTHRRGREGLALLDQRATAFLQREKRLIAGDRSQDVVVVPGAGRLRRRLDLDEIHVVQEPAVCAHRAVLGIEVVHRNLVHLGHDRFRLIGAGCLDRT